MGFNTLKEDNYSMWPDRKYVKCPLCKVKNWWFRSNCSLAKHMERKHGVAIKRY